MEQRTTKQKIEHWATHKCWRCGLHSMDDRRTRMRTLGNGYICEKCYKELFGN